MILGCRRGWGGGRGWLEGGLGGSLFVSSVSLGMKWNVV